MPDDPGGSTDQQIRGHILERGIALYPPPFRTLTFAWVVTSADAEYCAHASFLNGSHQQRMPLLHPGLLAPPHKLVSASTGRATTSIPIDGTSGDGAGEGYSPLCRRESIGCRLTIGYSVCCRNRPRICNDLLTVVSDQESVSSAQPNPNERDVDKSFLSTEPSVIVLRRSWIEV